MADRGGGRGDDPDHAGGAVVSDAVEQAIRATPEYQAGVAFGVPLVALEDHAIALATAARRAALAEIDARALGVRGALRMLDQLLAFSSRDWSQSDVDARLYAVLCGWDCEDGECSNPGNPKHDHAVAMTEIAQRFGWTPEVVARLRELRASVREVVR